MSIITSQAREMAAIHMSDEIESNDQQSCEIQMDQISVNDQNIDGNDDSLDIENSNSAWEL
jgi:hypothetical protein